MICIESHFILFYFDYLYSNLSHTEFNGQKQAFFLEACKTTKVVLKSPELYFTE